MQNSKLIQVLKTFSIEEWKEYEKLVASPFFNKGRNLVPYVKVLTKFKPEFDSPKLTKEYVYSKVHRGRSYNDNTMKNSMSLLLNMAEEYLKWSYMQNFDIFGIKPLVGSYDERHLFKFGFEAIEKGQKWLDSYGYDEHYFNESRYLSMSKGSILLNIDKQHEVVEISERTGTLNMISFLSSAQKSIHNLLANQDNYNAPLKDNYLIACFQALDMGRLIEATFKFKNEFTEITLIYLYLIKLIAEGPDAESYEKVKNLYFKNFERLSPLDKDHILVSLEAIARNKLKNINYPRYKHEYFDLVKKRLGMGLHKFSALHGFPILRFRAFFQAALEAGDLKWAKDFTGNYTPEINEIYRKSAKAWSEAMLKFYDSKFEKCLEQILKVTYEFPLFKLDTRILQMLCYFELSHYEQAYSSLESISHFLNNNKGITRKVHMIYTNLLKAVKSLLMLSEGKTNELVKLELFLKNNSLPQWILPWFAGKMPVN